MSAYKQCDSNENMFSIMNMECFTNAMFILREVKTEMEHKRRGCGRAGEETRDPEEKEKKNGESRGERRKRKGEMRKILGKREREKAGRE